jgi:hypothetical protein
VIIGWPAVVFSAPSASPFALQRDTLVDAARGVTYVARPNGTIDAVDLSNGRILWSSTDAALPLGLDGDLLVAQIEKGPTNVLQVAVLDAVGGRKLASAAIPLPDGVQASVSDGRNQSFRAAADREGALFLISWIFQQRFEEGQEDNSDESDLHIYAGTARISPGTGNVLTADGGAVSGIPARWRQYDAPPFTPWQAGGLSVRTEGGRGGPLTLKRTNVATGRPQPDVILSEHGLLAMPSADQKHVLVSERVGQGGPGDPEYRWLVYATETGELATELRRDVSSGQFFVFGDSIVFQSQPHWNLVNGVRIDEPLQIEAVRLSTGVLKWTVELRDLTYRGAGVAAAGKGVKR